MSAKRDLQDDPEDRGRGGMAARRVTVLSVCRQCAAAFEVIDLSVIDRCPVCAGDGPREASS